MQYRTYRIPNHIHRTSAIDMVARHRRLQPNRNIDFFFVTRIESLKEGQMRDMKAYLDRPLDPRLRLFLNCITAKPLYPCRK
jgi:hypothetical protein